MRVILSRKGLDSAFDTLANMLIFSYDSEQKKPNAEMVMLPIPDKASKTTYNYLNFCNNISKSKKILDALNQYKNIDKETTCHVDPNIVNFFMKKKFLGSIGQVDQAQTHLENHKVGVGDLFIFFGLFNDWGDTHNVLFTATKRQDHIVFGYLQIGEIIYTNALTQKQRKDYEKKYPWLINQPHWNEDYKDRKNNCIYIARETCTFDEKIKGYGMFNYNKELVLTKQGENSPTHWQLPKDLQGLDISYHTKANQKEDYFQAVCRGQEFVIEECPQAENWAINLIKKYSKR